MTQAPHSPTPTAGAAVSPAGGHRLGAATAASTRGPRPVQRWQSSELLGAAQEVEIAHGAAVYRLRLTAMGKLILTK